MRVGPASLLLALAVERNSERDALLATVALRVVSKVEAVNFSLFPLHATIQSELVFEKHAPTQRTCAGSNS